MDSQVSASCDSSVSTTPFDSTELVTCWFSSMNGEAPAIHKDSRLPFPRTKSYTRDWNSLCPFDCTGGGMHQGAMKLVLEPDMFALLFGNCTIKDESLPFTIGGTELKNFFMVKMLGVDWTQVDMICMVILHNRDCKWT